MHIPFLFLPRIRQVLPVNINVPGQAEPVLADLSELFDFDEYDGLYIQPAAIVSIKTRAEPSGELVTLSMSNGDNEELDAEQSKTFLEAVGLRQPAIYAPTPSPLVIH